MNLQCPCYSLHTLNEVRTLYYALLQADNHKPTNHNHTLLITKYLIVLNLSFKSDWLIEMLVLGGKTHLPCIVNKRWTVFKLKQSRLCNPNTLESQSI